MIYFPSRVITIIIREKLIYIIKEKMNERQKELVKFLAIK